MLKIIEDELNEFSDYCKRYGYKYKIDEQTFMKRNRNVISFNEIF